MSDNDNEDDTGEILVIGPVLSNGSLWSFLLGAPRKVTSYEGAGGGSSVIIDLQEPEILVTGIRGTNIDVKISRADLNKLSPNQRFALEATIAGYKQGSTKFDQAIEHIGSKDADIILVVGRYYKDTNGVSHSWSEASPGVNAHMTITYNSNGDPTRQDIVGDVTIYINEEWYAQPANANANFEQFATDLIHEIFHPFVPDTPGQGNGLGTPEHNEVYNNATQAVRDIWNGKLPTNAPPSKMGAQFTGSSVGDVINGTVDSDVLAGMEGNDTLIGGNGTNALYGGLGNDTLVTTGFRDYLAGGDGADIYDLTQNTGGSYAFDRSGNDKAIFSYGYYEVEVGQVGNDLIISTLDYQPTKYIFKDHFINANRVEFFTFAGVNYASSAIASRIANEGSGPAVYYPVIIDLDSDGVSLLSIDEANLELDVDLDGTVEKVSWYSGNDGILAIDRDGNGLVTDASEMSFVGDLNGAKSDLEGLMAFDTNWDGVLSEEDQSFDKFVVWVDANGDRQSEESEIFSLGELGISSISLERKNIVDYSAEGADAQILSQSFATGAYGQYQIFDIGFGYAG